MISRRHIVQVYEIFRDADAGKSHFDGKLNQTMAIRTHGAFDVAGVSLGMRAWATRLVFLDGVIRGSVA